MTNLEKAYEAYRKNKLQRKSWRQLADELLAAGRREEAVLFGTLLQRHGGEIAPPAELTERDFKVGKGRDFFRLGLMNVSHAPLQVDIYDKNGQYVGLHYKSGAGSFLPGEYDSS